MSLPNTPGPRSRGRAGAGAMRDRDAAGSRAWPEGRPPRCRLAGVSWPGSSYLWGKGLSEKARRLLGLGGKGVSGQEGIPWPKAHTHTGQKSQTCLLKGAGALQSCGKEKPGQGFNQ